MIILPNILMILGSLLLDAPPLSSAPLWLDFLMLFFPACLMTFTMDM